MRVRSTARAFLRKWSAKERNDFLAIVSRANDLDLTVEKIERAISRAGNIARAADELGCSRRTLQNRMRKLGMPASRGGRPPGRRRFA